MSPGIIEEIPRNRDGKFVTDFVGGKEKAIKLGPIYADIAARWNIEFLDLQDVVEMSALDGVHLETSEHKKCAKAVFNRLSDFMRTSRPKVNVHRLIFYSNTTGKNSIT